MKCNFARITKGALAMVSVWSVGMAGFLSTAAAASKTDYSSLNTATQMVSVPEDVPLGSVAKDVRTQKFNNGWKFNLGDISGAQGVSYNDAKWRNVDLPHDYSIEQAFSKSMEAESGYLPGGVGWYRKNVEIPAEFSQKRVNLNFDGVYMDATIYVNGTELANHPYGYTPFSVDITDELKFGEKNVIAVKVNHQTPSSRWYSGSGIYRNVELMVTDKVHIGYNGVKVVAKDLESYTGSGNVDLELNTVLVNDGDVSKTVQVKQTVLPKNGGASIGEATNTLKLEANTTSAKTTNISVRSPKLWSLKDPTQYIVKTEVLENSTLLDSVDTVTGFRFLKFDPNTGFALNGKNLKLKGVSMHHDQGALGAKAYRDAIERQIDILKNMGVNTIRVTHNPGSQDLIELANEKGILLIEEIFDGLHCTKNYNRMDYARFFEKPVPTDTKLENVSPGSTWARFDLEAMIRRDHNAPSVIMWSLGNEIQEGTTCGINSFTANQANLVKWAAKIDPTRPVTRGDNAIKDSSAAINVMKSLVSGATAAGTVGTVGANYASGKQYDSLHQHFPNAMLYGSETASSVNSRGVYNRTFDSGQTADKQLTSYDNSRVGWGATAAQAWLDVIKRDFVAGTAVWTGFDYIGEPTFWNGVSAGAQGAWPSPKSSYFGIIDTAGFPKDSFYFYQSQWNEAVNTLHILPAWNKSVLQNNGNGDQKVVVYSNAHAVELFFTGNDGVKHSLGKKTFTKRQTPAGYTYQIYEGAGKSAHESENLYLSWQVPYADGTVSAVAYDSQDNVITETVGRGSVSTAGAASKLDVQLSKSNLTANNEDLSYLEVTVMDAKNVPVPDANIPVEFAATGGCEVIGTDAGEQADHTSYLSPRRNTYNGKVLGIVKSKKYAGKCTVKISAPNMPVVTKTITVAPSAGAMADSGIDSYLYPRNYYVQVGAKVILPAKIDAKFTDGTVESVGVKWNEIAENQYQKPGFFSVVGKTAKGHLVTANITMMQQVGAVLNYSANTPVGVVPTIPAVRPAVLPDGTVLEAQFDVVWKLPDNSVYNQVGKVEIQGTATVFGKKIPVNATIRVQEGEVTIGKSVTAAAKISQDIPADKQSDTLSAIQDGETAVGINKGGGANPTAWTNYTNSQAGDDTAAIEFEYATQQTFGAFDVYFFQDSYSARFPDAGTTKFYVKEAAGDAWKLVDAQEKISADESSPNVKKYSYALTKPINATFVKLAIKNKEENLDGRKPCTGITEVALKTASITMPAYTTADLESLSVNNEKISNSALKSWEYNTPAEKIVQLKAVPKENAAVTILPAYKGTVRLIVESENHEKLNIFQIHLGKTQTASADDDSRDVPIQKIKLEVGSQATTAGDNSKGSALDGDVHTIWHTPWGHANPINGDVNNLAKKGWVVFTLSEPTELEALRYLPRSDGNNGTITGYQIYVSNTDDPQGETQADGMKLPADNQYQLVSQGSWDDNTDWKLAEFTKASLAKYVKLVPTATASDSGANMFVSAAELRLRQAKSLIDLNDPALGFKVNVDPAVVEVGAVDAQHPAHPDKVIVKGADGKILTEGLNYRLKYEGDTKAGVAKITVTGINTHKGELVATYMIKVKTKPNGSDADTGSGAGSGDSSSSGDNSGAGSGGDNSGSGSGSGADGSGTGGSGSNSGTGSSPSVEPPATGSPSAEPPSAANPDSTPPVASSTPSTKSNSATSQKAAQRLVQTGLGVFALLNLAVACALSGILIYRRKNIS